MTKKSIWLLGFVGSSKSYCLFNKHNIVCTKGLILIQTECKEQEGNECLNSKNTIFSLSSQVINVRLQL